MAYSPANLPTAPSLVRVRAPALLAIALLAVAEVPPAAAQQPVEQPDASHIVLLFLVLVTELVVLRDPLARDPSRLVRDEPARALDARFGAHAVRRARLDRLNAQLRRALQHRRAPVERHGREHVREWVLKERQRGAVARARPWRLGEDRRG